MRTLQQWFQRMPLLITSIRRTALSILNSLRWPSFRARAVCILVLLAVMLVLNGMKADIRALLLDFGATNGTFQAYNPLRRMHSGQAMFHDFYPYLGLGPTVTSYLALRIEGNGFGASVHALEILAGLTHIGTLLLLARLCRLSWFWSCAVSAALVLIGITLCPTIEHVYTPGADHWAARIHGLFFMTQSAIALRAAAPTLLCLFLAVRPTVKAAPDWRHWLRDGIPAGLALVWSNDYGLPTFALFTLLFGLLAPGICWRDRIQRCTGIVVVGGIVGIVVVSLLTSGQPWRWVQYNAGVAADQFWYYEGIKILRVPEIPVSPSVAVGLIATFFLAVDLFRRPQSLDTRCMLLMLSATLGAGYLSSVGGHVDKHYFTAFERVLTFAAPYAFARILSAIGGVLPSVRTTAILAWTWIRNYGRLRWAMAFAQISLTFIIAREAYLLRRDHIRANRLPQHTLHVSEFGGHLSEPWSKMVAISREMRSQREDKRSILFSTYATSFETIIGEFQPTGHDYIIHALGSDERRRYLDVFREQQPKYAITLRNDTWPWEQWIRRMHWDFYRELLRHYDPWDRCIVHLIWQRRETPREFRVVPVTLRAENVSPAEVLVSVALPHDAGLGDDMHYVEIELEAFGAWRTPRFWNGAWRHRLAVIDPAKPDSPFFERSSIPLGRRWRFPMRVRTGGAAQLALRLGPEEHSRLELRYLSARYVLPASTIDDFPLRRLRAASVDSIPWRHGIQNLDDHRSIICVSDPSDLKHLRIGMRLRFAESGAREITRLDVNHVYLSGPPLDPDRDGYPAAIQIIP